MSPQRDLILSTRAASIGGQSATKPSYPFGWAAGSQARGDAVPSNPRYRFVVGFDNGNVNDNNDDNRFRARAVRVPREYQGAEESLFQQLYRAWREARRGKKPSRSQFEFERNWADNLLQLEQEILSGTWQPSPCTCFVATRPKAREIHAPDFRDRVVHHWWVTRVEPGCERKFIDDSYANRVGKGTLAAVHRAQTFMRRLQSGKGGGFFLQLDIRNFFYSINRKLLWAIVKRELEQQGQPEHVLRVAHALLAHSALDYGVVYRASAEMRAKVPLHKRLVNALKHCGLPIGNLSSQFLANVFLNVLDQFCKHVLKVRHYLRYVDDFVLFSTSREQLQVWKGQIEQFLAERLQLRLKDDVRLRRLDDGLDFLGYIIRPSHLRARRRVVSHAREAFQSWERQHVRGRHLVATPAQLRQIVSVSASYQGQFKHAATFRLRRGLHQRFPWLHDASQPHRFHHSLETRQLRIRWQPPKVIRK